MPSSLILPGFFHISFDIIGGTSFYRVFVLAGLGVDARSAEELFRSSDYLHFRGPPFALFLIGLSKYYIRVYFGTNF